MAEPTRITLATPIMMPRSVRKLRSLWARMESQASPDSAGNLVGEAHLAVFSRFACLCGNPQQSYYSGYPYGSTQTGVRLFAGKLGHHMRSRLIRPLLVIEFLVAIEVCFTFWSEVGGQYDLDLMFWPWKFGLTLAAAGLITAITAELVRGGRDRAGWLFMARCCLRWW